MLTSRVLILVALAALATPPVAQTPIVHDADRAAAAPLTIGPNGTRNGRPAFIVQGEVAWSDQHIVVESANGATCDLVVDPGGRLSVRDCQLGIRGDVYLESNGRLAAIGSRVSLLCTFSREFRFWWRGGHLYTERVSIGGHANAAGHVRHTNFELHSGVWTLRDTVVRDSYGIVLGYLAAPAGSQGGTLDADGLVQGRASDSIILSGRGDATLRNSVFPVKMVLEPTGPQTLTVDLSNQPVALEVYGDSTAHDALNRAAVSRHIPGCPWRLELRDSTVPIWFFCVAGVTDGGPTLDYTLENTSECYLRAIMHDVQGSPTLVGPWQTFYPPPNRLSDLPSARPPGRHAIPPGCGVQIANVTFRAPANAWAFPQSWSLNLTGNSNFTVSGPLSIGEMYLNDTSTLSIQGDDPSQIGLLATTIDVDGNASLDVHKATVVPLAYGYGQVEARGNALIALTDVVLGNVALRTTPGAFGPTSGVDNARIVIDGAYHKGSVNPSVSPGGTIILDDPDPDGALGGSNLDFESPLHPNGTPQHWWAEGLAGYASADTCPLGGTTSYGYRSTLPDGSLQKALRAVPDMQIELGGWIKLVSASPAATVTLRVGGTLGDARTIHPTLRHDAWTYVRVPNYRVTPTDTAVRISIGHTGATGTFEMLLDGFTTSASQWWDSNVTANDDFELPSAYVGGAHSAPPNWDRWRVAASSEFVDLAPGATPGSRAARLTLTAGWGQIYKGLRGLAPGQTIAVRGWVKPLPHPNGNYSWKLRIGENNPCAWDPLYGNNLVLEIPVGVGWVPIDLEYTVPGAPFKEAETRLQLAGGRLGAEILVDEFEVVIR